MSWTRPSLTTLITRIKSDFSSRLLGGAFVLAGGVVAVLARIWAGAVHLLHGFLEWCSLQLFVSTCEGEYLDKRAANYGLTRTAASYAAGAVGFTGEDDGVVAAGTELERDADGALYTLDADVTIADGTGTGTVTAREAGADGNTDAGAGLSLTATVDGVAVAATVGDDGLTGGADEEDDDSLRARLLDRLQNPPHGGCKSDYVTWAEAVAGVGTAWCLPLYYGLGTVGVTFIADSDLYDDPIPSDTLVQAVTAAIETNRPATADVTVFAPERDIIDLTLAISPDTTAVRAAAETELAALFDREACADGLTLYLTHIHEAVSAAADEEDHTIVSPTANVVVSKGHFPVLGTITWQSEGE